MLTIFSVVV